MRDVGVGGRLVDAQLDRGRGAAVRAARRDGELGGRCERGRLTRDRTGRRIEQQAGRQRRGHGPAGHGSIHGREVALDRYVDQEVRARSRVREVGGDGAARATTATAESTAAASATTGGQEQGGCQKDEVAFVQDHSCARSVGQRFERLVPLRSGWGCGPIAEPVVRKAAPPACGSIWKLPRTRTKQPAGWVPLPKRKSIPGESHPDARFCIVVGRAACPRFRWGLRGAAASAGTATAIANRSQREVRSRRAPAESPFPGHDEPRPRPLNRAGTSAATRPPSRGP